MHVQGVRVKIEANFRHKNICHFNYLLNNKHNVNSNFNIFTEAVATLAMEMEILITWGITCEPSKLHSSLRFLLTLSSHKVCLSPYLEMQRVHMYKSEYPISTISFSLVKYFREETSFISFPDEKVPLTSYSCILNKSILGYTYTRVRIQLQLFNINFTIQEESLPCL